MRKLAGLRVMAGLTQAEVAKALNITQGAVSAWEQGKKNPTFDKVSRLAKLYKVSEQTIISICTETPTKGSCRFIKRKKRKFSPTRKETTKW